MRINVPAYHLLLVVSCVLMGRIQAIEIFEVGVPAAVRAGDNVLLSCHYDLEGDVLYSIKWYKGRREFYRYTLKENPAKKAFKVAGMNVDLTKSNASHVQLISVVAANSGKYGCEASADAPSFHTQILFKEMTVVDIPDQRPTLMGLKDKYADGELLMANCTSRNSRPAANLTWTINEKNVPPSQIYHVKPVRDEATNLHTTTTGIHFVVTSQQYVQGKLKLKCTAKLFDIYSQSTEKVIESDNQDLSSIVLPHDRQAMSNNSVYNFNKHFANNNNNLNVFQTTGENLHDFENYGRGNSGQENKNEAYMTPIQADMSSALRSASPTICTLFLAIIFQLLGNQLTITNYWSLRIPGCETI